MRRSLCVAVVIVGLGAIALAQSVTDWTQWRGPARDGVIASFTPPAAWPDALVKRWNVEIGTGYATPIVVGDRVYQLLNGYNTPGRSGMLSLRWNAN